MKLRSCWWWFKWLSPSLYFLWRENGFSNLRGCNLTLGPAGFLLGVCMCCKQLLLYDENCFGVVFGDVVPLGICWWGGSDCVLYRDDGTPCQDRWETHCATDFVKFLLVFASFCVLFSCWIVVMALLFPPSVRTLESPGSWLLLMDSMHTHIGICQTYTVM